MRTRHNVGKGGGGGAVFCVGQQQVRVLLATEFSLRYNSTHTRTVIFFSVRWVLLVERETFSRLAVSARSTDISFCVPLRMMWETAG